MLDTSQHTTYPSQSFDSAKLELEQRVTLYRDFYNFFAKGLAFYFGVTGVLGKFALEADDTRQRILFIWLGIAACVITYVVTFSSMNRAREVYGKDFTRLAVATHTKPIDVTFLLFSYKVVFSGVSILLASWLYILVAS